MSINGFPGLNGTANATSPVTNVVTGPFVLGVLNATGSTPFAYARPWRINPTESYWGFEVVSLVGPDPTIPHYFAADIGGAAVVYWARPVPDADNGYNVTMVNHAISVATPDSALVPPDDAYPLFSRPGIDTLADHVSQRFPAVLFAANTTSGPLVPLQRADDRAHWVGGLYYCPTANYNGTIAPIPTVVAAGVNVRSVEGCEVARLQLI